MPDIRHILSAFFQNQILDSGDFKLCHIPVHPADDFFVIILGNFGIVHVPAGKFFCQYFIEHIVFIQGNGFMNTSFGKSPGGNDGPIPDFGQGGTEGEKLAFQVIIVLKAVISPGGVQHPVSDIYQVQQSSEFLGCQIDLHGTPPRVFAHIIALFFLISRL